MSHIILPITAVTECCRIGPSGYDAAWSTLQWVRDDYDVSPDPMWITQLAHWNRALDAQHEMDGGHVGTFGSFNTRMVCCEMLPTPF